MRWLRRDGGPEIVPIVGSNPHIYKTVVEPHPDMNFAASKLENLLNKRIAHADGWRLVDEPSGVGSLPSGTSLVNYLPPPPPPANIN